MNFKLNNTTNKQEESIDEMEAKAFLMDVARLERMHQREIEEKNKTAEQKEYDRLMAERMADLDKVVNGEMDFADFKLKWDE